MRVLLLISGASFVRGNYCLNKQFLLLKYGRSAEELSALLVFKWVEMMRSFKQVSVSASYFCLLRKAVRRLQTLVLLSKDLYCGA